MKKTLGFIAAILTLTLALAACSGRSDASPAPGDNEAAQPPAAEVPAVPVENTQSTETTTAVESKLETTAPAAQ